MRKKRVVLELSTGETVLIEANLPVETGVVERSDRLKKISFDKIRKTITACSQEFANTLNSISDDIAPSTVSVEFGIEIGAESGQLASYIVNASSKASFNVTLEWDFKK